jgi:hypothetical protein
VKREFKLALGLGGLDVEADKRGMIKIYDPMDESVPRFTNIQCML